MKMKKLLKLFIIILLLTITSGCVKYNEEMKIYNNKSMDIKIFVSIDSSISDYKFNIDELKKVGYTIKEFKKDNYTGIELNYKIKNIDKVSSNNDITYSLTEIRSKVPDKMFKVKKGWLKNYYKANFIFDSTDIDPLIINDEEKEVIEYLCDDGTIISVNRNEEIKEGCHRVFDYEIDNAKKNKPLDKDELDNMITKDIELKYSVHLPNKSISNNIDDNKKNQHIKNLTWKLNNNGVTSINYEFYLINYFNLFITVIIILALLFGVYTINRKKYINKKIKKNNRQNN